MREAKKQILKIWFKKWKYDWCTCFHSCVLVAQLCLTLCDPKDCSQPGTSFMDFSRQENWNELPSLLQEIFLTQGLNLGLLHCQPSIHGRKAKNCTTLFSYENNETFKLHIMLWDLTHPLFNFSIAFNYLKVLEKNQPLKKFLTTHIHMHAHTRTHTLTHGCSCLVASSFSLAQNSTVYLQFWFFSSSWTFLPEFWNILKTLHEMLPILMTQVLGHPWESLIPRGQGLQGRGVEVPFCPLSSGPWRLREAPAPGSPISSLAQSWNWNWTPS